MWKHIFNLRMLILVGAIVAVVAVIIGQQSLLDAKMDEYEDAAANYEAVSTEKDKLDDEKNSELSDEDIEGIAREEGYVDDDEIVFIYD